MKKILFILVANIALFTGTVFASESVGSISTGISTGLDFTLPCNPVSVLNGSVNPQTCTITCNSGYTLSGTTCNAVPVTGWGGGGGGGGGSSGSPVPLVTSPSTSTQPATTNTTTVSTPPSSVSTSPTELQKNTTNTTKVVPIATDITWNWANSYITVLIKNEIVANSKNYRSDDYLTRAEFLKIVWNAEGWNLNSAATTKYDFDDIQSNSWVTGYVRYAVANNLITNSKKFRPNDPISRAEVSKILAISRKYQISKYKGVFSDVPRWNTLALYIEAMKNEGVFQWQLVNTKLIFRPNDQITRAEIAKVVVNAFDLK